MAYPTYFGNNAATASHKGKQEGWVCQRWKVKRAAGKGRTWLVLFDPEELCYSERLTAAKSVCELWAFLQRSDGGTFTLIQRPTK